MALGNYIANIQTDLPWLPGWLIAVTLFFALLAAGFALQYLIMKVLASYHVGKSPLSQSVFRRTKAVVRYAFCLLAVKIALPLVPLPAEAAQAVHNLTAAAFVVLLGWIMIIATNTIADRYALRLKLDGDDTLLVRKAVTQIRILRRAAGTLIILVTIGLALMNFESVRQFGVSLFASAGIAGLVLGLAARPVLENFLAGIQLAITQPIRIDDAVVVENESGRVEEIGSTYVVVRLWDRRRLILPLSYFLEKPFQNWTRTSASLIGSVYFHLDYTTPVDQIRAKLNLILKESKLWDGDIANLQVTDAKEDTIEIRILVSARNSSAAWDLRCEVREKLLAYIQSELALAIPHHRSLVQSAQADRNPPSARVHSALN